MSNPSTLYPTDQRSSRPTTMASFDPMLAYNSSYYHEGASFSQNDGDPFTRADIMNSSANSANGPNSRAGSQMPDPAAHHPWPNGSNSYQDDAREYYRTPSSHPDHLGMWPYNDLGQHARHTQFFTAPTTMSHPQQSSGGYHNPQFHSAIGQNGFDLSFLPSFGYDPQPLNTSSPIVNATATNSHRPAISSYAQRQAPHGSRSFLPNNAIRLPRPELEDGMLYASANKVAPAPSQQAAPLKPDRTT